MRRKMDFLRHATPKMGIKKKPCSWQGFTNHFGRMNLSLIGCFPAEPISVSIQHFKIHSTKLYLQPVKFSNQLPPCNCLAVTGGTIHRNITWGITSQFWGTIILFYKICR
jgi:hypothetical protein